MVDTWQVLTRIADTVGEVCLHCFVDKDHKHDRYFVKLYQWRASATVPVIPMKMLERHAEIKRRAFIEQST